MHSEEIEKLRASLARPSLAEAPARYPLGLAEADLCLRGGIQRGALHEVFAAAGHEASATGFVTGLAIRVSGNRPLLWIQPDFSVPEYGLLCPPGLCEFGLDPARLLLLNVPTITDSFRAALDALSCAALGGVIIEIPGKAKALDLAASRRLTLAAARQAVTCFLLHFRGHMAASTAETRWEVRSSSCLRDGRWGYPTFKAGLVRNRSGLTGQWVMEWNCNDGCFQEVSAYTGLVVPAPDNGTPAAA